MQLKKREDEMGILQENMRDQNCEIETLRKLLCTYQQQMIEIKKSLKDSEKEMVLLKQTIGEERKESAKLGKINESELQIIHDLTQNLKSESEKNDTLKNSNENLMKLLSMEQDANRNLTKEIEIQQAKIEELVAKRIWDEAGSREEEQHLSEELQRARQGILEQENERMRTQVENESLMLKLAELETELAKKAELVVELQLKLEKLKVENENITEGAKMMIESQRQLNAHLTEANGSLNKEKLHVQKTMQKLKSTHRRDLSKIIGTLTKLILIKNKESEDLQQRLERKDALLAKLAAARSPACCQCERKIVREGLQRVQMPQDYLQHPNDWWERKQNLVGLLASMSPESSKSSASSSLQLVKSCSNRGDINSIDGFVQLRTSTFRSLHERIGSLSIRSEPHMYASLKQPGKRADFSDLIRLGISHLIGQAERSKRTNRQILPSENKKDLSSIRPRGMKVDEIIQTSTVMVTADTVRLQPRVSELSSDQRFEEGPRMLWTHSKSDSTLFRLFSRICSNIYEVISRLVVDSTS
ncbi:unnamed protein product [Bemisia tabaci]|uniref:Uncharacterized protein n=1 Tax=Bemisia tabaci TaxID=7038 RepID=A0A9P0F3Z0_BEMTA|nr:unnamed protein product [Bemisia tabaci]